MARVMTRDRRPWSLQVLALALLLGCWPAQAGAEEVTWDERTWVLIVGVLDYADEGVDSFPHTNRQDTELARFFRDRGVPADQVVTVLDQQATLAGIRAAFAALLERTRPDDRVVFYFTGHGSREADGEVYLIPHDAVVEDLLTTGLRVAEVFDHLESGFRGDEAWLIVDCCLSGDVAMTAARRVIQGRDRISYVCLGSSQPDQLSTENWTFTRCVLDALRGDRRVDLDGDGQILISELFRRSQQVMAFTEEQMAACLVTGQADPDDVVSQVNADPVDERLGQLLEAYSESGGESGWYRAVVVEVRPRQVKVHFLGFGDEWDEWVGPDRQRPWEPVHHPVGTRLQVQYEEAWYGATVLEARWGLHLIRYDDHTDDWDEWVAPERIRVE
jgi:Caspase domain